MYKHLEDAREHERLRLEEERKRNAAHKVS